MSIPSFVQKCLKPGDGWVEQFFRYFIVGGLATIVHWTLFGVLHRGFSFHPVAATSIGFAFGLFVNYLMSIRVVFSRRNVSNRWLERALFAGIALIGLGLNSGIVWIGIETAGLLPEIAQVIATAITFGWNFLSKKLFLFR